MPANLPFLPWARGEEEPNRQEAVEVAVGTLERHCWWVVVGAEGWGLVAQNLTEVVGVEGAELVARKLTEVVEAAAGMQP
jgi:hypothetical protein